MISNVSQANSSNALLDHFFRKQVLNQLKSIKEGRITFTDAIGEETVGSGQFEMLFNVSITVHSMEFYRAVALGGSIGAAESYMDGDWKTSDLTTLMQILVRNRDIIDNMEGGAALITNMGRKVWHAFNKNTKDGSRRNIAAHYDLSNDFFKLFLDKHLMYSSALFSSIEEDLETASERKLDSICQQLKLCESDHVLEIGTGWGGFAIFAAKNYGCKVTTTTISQQQFDEAQQRIKSAGLESKINLLLKDYRDLTGQYNKLVSIEMVEAVGHHFLDGYFQKISELLTDDGVAFIQAITLEDHRYEYSLKQVDFIKRYIFPGSFIPCVTALTQSAAKSQLRNIGLRDIGNSYALTLYHWRKRFFNQLEAVKHLGFDDSFIRMWEFYLCYCEGGFWEGAISNAQLLFAKPHFVRHHTSF